MTAVRAVFRTAWKETSRPAELMQRVNAHLCEEHLKGFFVTAICVRVDVARGELTLSVGGHDPILLLRGASVELGGKQLRQLPLGILPETVYQEATYELQPGDAFVFYTDGVTEARNEFKNAFGMRRLQEVVERCAGRDAATVVQEITSALDAHVGRTPPHDDVTLLVGRRMPV